MQKRKPQLGPGIGPEWLYFADNQADPRQFVGPLIEVAGEVTAGVAEALAGVATGLHVSVQHETTADWIKRVSTKVNVQQEDDNKKLVKVSDAIKCVEDFWNNQSQLRVWLQALWNVIRGGEQIQNFADLMSLYCATCIRSHALPQTNPRTYQQKQGYFRR